MPAEKNNDTKANIVWFRDDLRVSDHPALSHAAQSGQPILPIFILDEESENIRAFGPAQKWFLHQALEGLNTKLIKLGAPLAVFRGNAETVLKDITEKNDIHGIYWNRRCGMGELAVDVKLKAQFTEDGFDVQSFQGNLLHEPIKTKTGQGGPYRVYTPFWRTLEAQGEPRAPLAAPEKLIPVVAPKLDKACGIDGLDLLPLNPDWAAGWEKFWHANEDGAQERLSEFLDHDIAGYKQGRDFPGRTNVSRLSPHLRFGTVSPFQIWHQVKHREAANKIGNGDAEKFLKEVGWREFSYHLLFHYPEIGWKNFQSRFDDFPWRTDAFDHLQLWKKGMTGFPIVDAGMRELWQTGYMHNRVRMVVGSFLVKHLLIDWRDGEKWFWETLIDGDPANNTASWQWIAGCGADAAPYFRVFNPILQGKKFDTDGSYVRRYVPELAKLSDNFLHNPWEAPKEMLQQWGVTLGKTYPHPIVDHSVARDRALAAFAELKKAGE
jgi:deoxyribodipyrimidine photo-lyase